MVSVTSVSSNYYREMISIGAIGNLVLVIRLYDRLGIEGVSMCNIGVCNAVIRVLPVLVVFILLLHHLYMTNCRYW